VRLSKGCVLGPGVVLPHNAHLEASILVASSEQNKESLEQNEGKLHRSQTTFYYFIAKKSRKLHGTRCEKYIEQGTTIIRFLAKNSFSSLGVGLRAPQHERLTC
jgi:hypothetical protein